ncbi:MAG TPA: hypothetical protein GXX67_06055 [Petrimonas sp.]|nr:hypothetical protein [Petrimonas sp.]
MNIARKTVIIVGAMTLLLVSCKNDDYGPRKESVPLIEAAAVTPSSFTFGDSITLTATVSDPLTTLTMLSYEVVAGDRTLTSGEIPIGGTEQKVSQSLFIPLLNNQPDNAEMHVNLLATNTLKGEATHQVTGLTGKRPVYGQLYLITDKGGTAILRPQASGSNKFKADELTFDSSFRYRIAERLHVSGTIDFSGDVYGNVGGRIGMIDETGESAFSYAASSDYTQSFLFDVYSFEVTPTGSMLGSDDLSLRAFTDKDIDGESFRTLKRTLEKGKSYSLFGDLAERIVLFNPDFFERTAANKVTFLGQTGEYTLYYNPVRKNLFAEVDNPSFPDYLLACGWGLGYPTRVTSTQINSVYPGKGRTHTQWGFGNVMNYVLLRQIETGVYQGTFYTPNDHDHYAGFKPFENTGWGNEKKAGYFTFTGEPIITGDNDWTIPNGEGDPVIESTHYRFTINLNNMTVHIEKWETQNPEYNTW